MNTPYTEVTSAMETTAANLSPQQRPLPTCQKTEGMPVWEPSIFDNAHIGEEYEKKPEAALKCTDDDNAKTICILDIDAEFRLYRPYHSWACREWNEAEVASDLERKAFFTGLLAELCVDESDLAEKHIALGVWINRDVDGTWKVRDETPSGDELPSDWPYEGSFEGSFDLVDTKKYIHRSVRRQDIEVLNSEPVSGSREQRQRKLEQE